MYCSQCGFNMGDDAKFCQNCGRHMNSQASSQSLGNVGQSSVQPDISVNAYFDNAPTAVAPENKHNFWWGLLCIFMPPLVGFILYFMWREKYPRRAKVCLWCGIVAIAINYYYLYLL